MSDGNFKIKTMNIDEIRTAVQWAANEGWNPGLNDAESFYAEDPQGFLIGYLDEEPIGCISAVSYKGGFGFLGFYIVTPKYRGKGYGIRLWNEGIQKLQGHNIGLDGVFEQQENYKKSGFKLAYSNIRFECTQLPTEHNSSNLLNINEADFTGLNKYDRLMFPAEREKFLKAWINMPDSQGFAHVYNGSIKGYGVIRKCLKGYKIGPLFADDYHTAHNIFAALCKYAESGEPVYLDVPEVNLQGLKLAEKYNMVKVFGTARMYDRHQPNIDLERIFGVTTFELG